MDVRTINTKNRILNGLIKVLSTQKLSECRTIDIINQAALCPVKYTDQIDKNFRRLDCGIVPRSSRFCLCKRVWY
ncbi:hypothetical protein N134_07895 [Limosilactobacillus reuteri TD1]|uniref:Uncharacterized protein n=1 Tax=Limosilactobacillus reuteri TD1 TaxID=1358027 RepID=S5NWE8_LIMRT|nr:hypothetical protein N134_07895 [Limosilactobacillus reuteri TD1]